MDSFSSHAPALDSPIQNGAQITPNDTSDLIAVSRAIFVGTGGDLSIVTVGGDTLTFRSLAAGSLLPVRASRVLASNTTASDLLGLW